MPKISFPDPIKYLINGSNPSIFEAISNEMTLNYLVIDGCLVPGHGSINAQPLNGKIQRIYKSYKNNAVYIVAGNIGYRLNSLGELDDVFRLTVSSGYIQIDENDNNELGITTGAALYIYNYGPTPGLTRIPVVLSNGFILNNPCSIVCVDTFFFVADAYTSEIQVSGANNGTLWNPVQKFSFQSTADNIKSLAIVDRTLFVIGNYGTERWVVVGGTQLVSRDNVFLKKYGIYDINSFVNKENIFVAITSGTIGDIAIRVFEGGQFYSITSPGMMKEILNAGVVQNSDLYEIDSIRYYEISCERYSFIYNFSTKTWTHSTGFFQQVVSIDRNTSYVGIDSSLYLVDKYNTEGLKRRICPDGFIDPLYSRFTVNQLKLWYSNPRLLTGDVSISGSLDGVTVTPVVHRKIDGETYYQLIERDFNCDCFQFSLIIETKLNVLIRTMALPISLQSGRYGE